MTKRTLQLFQLLLAVFGFYAAIKYATPNKFIVSLSCLALVVILDKLELVVGNNTEPTELTKKPKPDAAPPEKQKQQLDLILHSKNVTLLNDIIQRMFRDLGLSITPCPENRGVDRVLNLTGGTTHLGIKIISDVDQPSDEWEQWEKFNEFEHADGQNHRLLIIANNAATEPQETGQEYKDFPVHVRKLLTEKKIIAMTTQTLYSLYQMCKEMNQNPEKIFNRIYQHPGGVFRV